MSCGSVEGTRAELGQQLRAAPRLLTASRPELSSVSTCLCKLKDPISPQPTLGHLGALVVMSPLCGLASGRQNFGALCRPRSRHSVSLAQVEA